MVILSAKLGYISSYPGKYKTRTQELTWGAIRVFLKSFYRICPNTLLTFFSTAPANPNTTGIAVYPIFIAEKELIFSHVHVTLHFPLSVHPSVGWSHFTFFMIFILGPYCSCPNGLVISNMAPAHTHTTWVAVYLALFLVGVGDSCMRF